MAGQILTVTSGKGGVGKTTTTANIGTALAMMGRSVVLIDADIGLRNLDIVMGLENRIVYDLVDVVEGTCRVRQAMIRDKRFPNLSLIPAAQTRDKDSVTPRQMVELTRELANEHDFVIVDSPAGIEQGFRNAIAGAQRVLVVTTPEVSAVRDADRIIGLVEAAEIPPPSLIVNRFRPEMVRKRRHDGRAGRGGDTRHPARRGGAGGCEHYHEHKPGRGGSVRPALACGLGVPRYCPPPDGRRGALSPLRGTPGGHDGSATAGVRLRINEDDGLRTRDDVKCDSGLRSPYEEGGMRFLRGFGRQEQAPPQPPTSGSVAKQRLKVVLVADQAQFPPGLVAAIRDDLMDVLSRRMDIDPEGIELTVTPGRETDHLTAHIPIKRQTRPRRY